MPPGLESHVSSSTGYPHHVMQREEGNEKIQGTKVTDALNHVCTTRPQRIPHEHPDQTESLFKLWLCG